MSEHLDTSADIRAIKALNELTSFLDRNGATKQLAYVINQLIEARIEQALEEERRHRFEEIEALRADIGNATGIIP